MFLKGYPGWGANPGSFDFVYFLIPSQSLKKPFKTVVKCYTSHPTDSGIPMYDHHKSQNSPKLGILVPVLATP
jgi:hypothetical protein